MEMELLGKKKLSIEKRLVRAKVQLLMSQPFFGTLAYHLKLVEKPAEWFTANMLVPTAATDGKYIYYNKEYIEKFSDDSFILFSVAHETIHPALGHLDRCGHRNKQRWNYACDYAVNDILHEAGFTIPEGCLYDKKYHNMHAEKIYEQLPETELPVFDTLILVGDSGGDREDKKEKDGAGEQEQKEDRGATTAKAKALTADLEEVKKWRLYVAEAATVARMQGKLPAGIEELLKDILAPKVDWREVLRQFLVSNFKNDYSFLPPSKKHIHNGLVLPSLKTEGIGTVAMGVDVSGSISTEDAKQFFGEVQGVLDIFDTELHVLQHDVEVTKHDIYHKGDILGEVEIKGRGGTSHVPLFEYIEQENIHPVCAICLTDAYSDFPEEAPDYPVLWVVTPEHGTLPEWGDRIVLD